MEIHLPSREKRRVIIAGAATVALGAAVAYMASAHSVTAHGGAHGPDPASATSITFKPNFPVDVDIATVDRLDAKGNDGIVEAQRLFDTLSWQTFVALNWPTDTSGKPLPNMAAKGPRAWNFWRNADTIFLPNGQKPSVANPVHLAMNDNNTTTETLFRAKAADAPNNAGENFQAFSGPMVDLNGQWVRYEVLVNNPEFSYILNNGLYSLEGQAAFTQRYSRSNPRNNVVELPINHGSEHGAIEIKLAWKQMGPGDDRSHFYTTTARVNVVNEGKTTQKTITVGLVGMHIAMHTASSPQWIWSTFEQVDNAPNCDTSDHPVGALKAHYNFYNPAQPALPVNTLAPQNALFDAKTGITKPDPDPATANSWLESATTVPTQAARLLVPTQPDLNPLDARIMDSADKLNKEVQATLHKSGSVFQYYKLIGTQWPVRPNAPAYQVGQGSAPQSVRYKTTGAVVPTFLVNSTMETFFQKGKQNGSNLEENAPTDTTQVIGTESCTGCHYSAGICIGFTTDGTHTPIFGGTNSGGFTGNANFSWLFAQEAQSTKGAKANAFALQSAPALRSPARFLSNLPRRGKATPPTPAPVTNP